MLLVHALFASATVHANVFSLIQSAGPDLETPQPGETFDFEIHFEQQTNLASLGFSLRATGGVRILSVVSAGSCFGPFAPFACEINLLTTSSFPNYQFDVSAGLAGPWLYIVSAPLGGPGAPAGTFDDATGPPGALLATVTVEYLSPGTLELFENSDTDDQSFAPPSVVTPTFDTVVLPAPPPPPLPYSVTFTDVTGDGDPPINVDLVSLELAFDPASGDYELIWRADPAQPFVGTFRLNANLYNPDTGSNDPDPAFFADTFNDLTLATPETVVTLTGNDPRLTAWGPGDRVSASCPDPIGCPNGIIAFLSAVGPLSGSAVGLDRLPPQTQVIVSTAAPVPSLSGAGLALLLGAACGGVTVLLRTRARSASRTGA